jgi:telomerase reverse transcriptase
MTRKRKFCDATNPAPRKRRAQTVNNQRNNHSSSDLPVSHELLSLYYPRIVSLRQFLLSSLPPSSTSRRRRLGTYGVDSQADTETPHLFDSTLIGVFSEPELAVQESRQRDFVAFTKSRQRSTDGTNGSTQTGRFTEVSDLSKHNELNSRLCPDFRPGCTNRVQVVEFAIWTLFNRARSTSQRPNHLLCHGFHRGSAHCAQGSIGAEVCTIPGLVSRHPNENYRLLRQAPWCELSGLLGNDGTRILQSLLLDCGIYIPLKTGKDNFYQLSGIPLSDLKPIDPSQSFLSNTGVSHGHKKSESISQRHGPADINFVKSRMFHAKPGLNATGNVRFGMKHIHVFNRFPLHDNVEHVVHNMKYVFPRQFGLHNVFTSDVDQRETVQRFKDYTLREHEIAQQEYKPLTKPADIVSKSRAVRVPRRLRGGAQTLVRKMLKNHRSCPYTQLLRHYCPAQTMCPSISANDSTTQLQRSSGSSTHPVTQIRATKSTISTTQHDLLISSHYQSSPSIVGFATPAANVSAFCRSAMCKILPRDALGTGLDGIRNHSNFMACIDRFIRMRRFESLSLHEVVQGMKLTCVPWLHPPGIKNSAKMSQSDYRKRLEIFLELLYYLFDSLLIPLVRSNFYVTESSTHRNQLFYFRQDVWRKLSEPSLAVLKIKMFEELKPHSATRLLNSRSLGFSHVRLLPKNNAFRPIINLKRRAMKKSGGVVVLEQSINKKLEPVFNTLNYEKSQQSAKLGSALFSAGELHDRLRNFKHGLVSPDNQQLYFVKVDVQTCFDTIPQAQLLEVVKDLISSDSYEIGKHAEIKPRDERWMSTARKATRKFVGSAHPADQLITFSPTAANELAQFKKRTVYNSTGNPRVWETQQLLKLLQEHVQQNIIKIGKKYFRQRNGIPQGSILSTLLCSFFYGHFETNHLSFLVNGESLLLRLIDDFLLITTNQSHARRFLQVMANGSKMYGVSVNTKKSLANFEILVNESKIPRLHGSTAFPYCGMLIDTRTLEVSKDRARKDALVSNTLTVEHGRRQGQSFCRKVLDSLKIQMHAMVLDTSLNAPALVAASLYQNFTETAMKMHRYLVSVPRRKQPVPELVIKVIKDSAKLAINSTSGRRRTKMVSEWTCSITNRHILWLAATAFEDVLRRKQTAYTAVLVWLRDLQMHCESSMKMNRKTRQVLMDGNRRVFKDYKF